MGFKGSPSSSSSASTPRCLPFPSSRSLTGKMELCLSSNSSSSLNNSSNNFSLVSSSSLLPNDSSSLLLNNNSSNNLLPKDSSSNSRPPHDHRHLTRQLLLGKKRLCRIASIFSLVSTFQTSASDVISLWFFINLVVFQQGF